MLNRYAYKHMLKNRYAHKNMLKLDLHINTC